ncbi:condensation domain-containing protein [Nocardia sp. NBC_01503]|uniref:condensation domain-containing protein n=1 Tax=Nocardia sp. NBC_01503 TaxID=2975997 RepID=UPI002E7B6D71|nr:condensation domain-containing protein [Nocardia sp. NBC_01503]WTL34001.1 condensation domain-containing protein [Nocardia sp. NBC_01503]
MTLETRTAAPARSERGLPLSPAQQAALLPERLARTAAANVYLALEIPAALADGVVARAAEVFAAHEVLRAVYPDDRRVPYQRVEAAPEIAAVGVEIGEAALAPALMTDAGHTFDLTRDPSIRLRVYRLSDRAVLSIAAHPVAADDRTLDLLAVQLCSADPVQAVAQYRDFTADQLKSLAAADDSLAFWTERLASLPDQLLLIGSRPATPRSARAVVELPADALNVLASAVAVPIVEPAAVLTALVAGALRELGAGEDVPIGVADEARTEAALPVLGNFANYLVLRVDSNRGSTPGQSVAATAALLARARAHAGTRIERLTHQLRGPGGAAQGGLFQVLAGVRAGVLEFAAEGGTVREIARAVARPHGVDLIVDAVVTERGWTVTVDLAEELSRRHAVDAFARLLLRTLESWSAAPDSVPDAADEVTPCGWFSSDDDSLDLDPFAISGLGGPPQTDAERAIAAALREILGLDEDDEVGREDNFFALGGDSVAALRFVTVLAERGHILDVQQVFEFPAVYEMAENLTAEGASEPVAPAVEVAPLAASGLDAAALNALAGKLAAR